MWDLCSVHWKVGKRLGDLTMDLFLEVITTLKGSSLAGKQLGCEANRSPPNIKDKNV
jgi:hypothetical protein